MVVGAASVAGAVLGPGGSITVIAVALEILFTAFFLRHFAFAVAALRSGPVDLRVPPTVDARFAPSVTVLVACKNEEAVVATLVDRLLNLSYPAELTQLVVVDDASSDHTAAQLDALARRHPRLECIHRSPRAQPGKSAALNAALPSVRGEIVVVFDADHQPDRHAVARLVRHFRDPMVGAVQGRCEVGNRRDSLLARLIALDYLAGYLVNEYGRQSLFRLPAYGGANCAVRTESLRALGGWNADSVTEDTDLTLRLRLRGQLVRYDVTAVDREEGVITLRRFWRQRYRWARGHQQVWRDYRTQVWRCPALSLAEKVETTMFLFVFHLPVATALGLVVAALWAAGMASPVDPLGLALFWTLLFLGPLLELGAGLLVAETDRRDAPMLVFFLPLFLVSIALCTKAWLDGLAGRRYAWVKTERAAAAPGWQVAG